MTIENNPFEVTGLERLVEDQSADYIGKDALMRIKAEGVKRKLVGIELGGEAQAEEAPEAWRAYKDGKEVGRVTAFVWSPRLEKNIGYVWVPIGLSAPGNVLDVATPRGMVQGQTVALPFHDPQKDIPKS